METKSRWQEIRKTSPSGKTMFVCLSCGVETAAPLEECPNPVRTLYQGQYYYLPCSAWPLDPGEYAAKIAQQEFGEAVFVGTIWLPDGPIQVTAPIPQELARQIAVVAVSYDLHDDKQRKKREAEIAILNKMRNAMPADQRKMLDELQRVKLEEKKEIQNNRWIGGVPTPKPHPGGLPAKPVTGQSGLVPMTQQEFERQLAALNAAAQRK